MSIRHALLALLHEGPKHGFQLRQEFEAGTGELWPLNVGQVYTTLQRLERDGLVEAAGDGDGPQKAYRLTGEGRAELLEWLGPPAELGPPPRDELVIKVLIAGRVDGVAVADVIQSHRRRLVAAMQELTRLKGDAAEDDLGLLLVADAELYRLDAAVRWLDTAEARLRLQPAPTGGRSAPAAPRRRSAVRS